MFCKIYKKEGLRLFHPSAPTSSLHHTFPLSAVTSGFSFFLSFFFISTESEVQLAVCLVLAYWYIFLWFSVILRRVKLLPG
jgi:uncharacterized membrane protein YgaE (UPF0421/DUF939 family)